MQISILVHISVEINRVILHTRPTDNLYVYVCVCVYVRLCLCLSLQCVLLGIFLVPIRAILLSLVLMVTWPVAVIITFKHPLKGTVEPMTGWRR